MDKSEFYHEPVLLNEAISELRIDPSGTYVDATFGGGGHSGAILRALKDGRLIGFDQDEDAKANIPEDDRFVFIPENFKYLSRFLRVHDAIPVSGILADLGVSSHQFDTADRGFSIRMDAPLDMRMDRRKERKAMDILHHCNMEELWKMFEDYGEVRNAKSLAAHLVEIRNKFPLRTIGELKNVLIPMIMGNERRYLAQVFQALRIEVNDEMGVLETFLEQAAGVLKTGGRLVVITFHSVEDRVVKRFIKRAAREDGGLRPVYKKPVLPSAEEIKRNPRAASAKMRVAEKC